MNAVTTHNLTKRYKDVTAVDNLNLFINKGELFSLLGVNGAGKTTAIKMLCCLTNPTDGDAFLQSNSIIANKQEVKSIIGVSPQETAVAPNLTVRENLELMAGVHGFDKDKTQVKINELTQQFHFNDIMSKRAKKLSGGWQRRLSIAMALISEPEILFLDEPTLGLDVIARSELWDLIRGLKGRKTIVLTTHYMEEAEALSDRVGVMKNGKLLFTGTPKEIKAKMGTDTFEQAFVKIIKEA